MTEPTGKRVRSPNYPFIDLNAAIQRARVMYSKEGRNTVPDDAVLEDWGYKARSGTSLSTLAALKHFGLLDSVGKGQVRLSDLAMTILLSESGTPEWIEALQQAALLPSIHQEILARHPSGLPSSDSALRMYLVRDRGFSDSAATDVIRETRATFDYAGVSFGDKSGAGGIDGTKEAPDLGQNLSQVFKGTAFPATKDPTVTTIPVLLPGAESVTIEGKFPISEVAWQQFLAVLNAMKPGLVADAPED